MTQYGIDKNGADCSDVRPHLKEIDPLFDVAFNYDSACYIVYFNGGLFQVVPWREMDKHMIDGIRKVYWTNINGDPIAEADAHNERLERYHENQRDDMVYELSKDLRKAILKEF